MDRRNVLPRNAPVSISHTTSLYNNSGRRPVQTTDQRGEEPSQSCGKGRPAKCALCRFATVDIRMLKCGHQVCVKCLTHKVQKIIIIITK